MGIAPHNSGGVNRNTSHDTAGKNGLANGSGYRNGNKRRITYKANNDDDGCVAGQLVVGGAEGNKLVSRTSCGTPMHARDSTRQHDGAGRSLPPGVGPRGAENKEQGERDDAGGHGDDGSAHDIDRRVYDDIILDRVVTDVVHAADGRTGQDASDGDSPPRNRVVGSNGNEGGQKHDDRDEEGQRREAAGVGNLQFGLSIAKIDGSVSDEVLPTRSDGRTLWS